MKYSQHFQSRINCKNESEVFKYLIGTLRETISTWDYFVNWNKVLGNISKVKGDLEHFNTLIGNPDVEGSFRKLITEHPKIIQLIPGFIACRQDKFEILNSYEKSNFSYKKYSFGKVKKLSHEELNDVVEFAKSSGFLNLFKNNHLTNIVDYLIGVEVGLDSNGRKNRGGDTMEIIVESFVADICQRHNLEYMPQATSDKVKQQWGKNITVDKSSRRIDFAINTDKGLYLIETNFYGGGGSKLKSTAGEYITMFDYWKNDGHKFIWVTDGIGWETTRLPLEETFNKTDYILNLNMLSKGLLEDIIINRL